MGRKSKLRRFAEIATFPNVFEKDPAGDSSLRNAEGVHYDLRARWAKGFFKNTNPIVLELACGKGDYTIALAKDDPDTNYIGVDIKGARMWKGAKHAIESSLRNVAFLRTRIEFIDAFFGPDEVSEIWITFPDPFAKKPTRRLTSPPFLDRYRKFLTKEGIVHLKTDSRLLYDYTLDVIYQDAGCKLIYANPDIYADALEYEALRHQTFYEKKHLAAEKKITYLRFTIN